jgi:hypothetical protein
MLTFSDCWLAVFWQYVELLARFGSSGPVLQKEWNTYRKNLNRSS